MAEAHLDSAVRIVVTPSQSSYFAGEPFSVTVTFTNTRSPDPGPSRAVSQPRSHRRNAHSISSAPIARPPTSPGTPRTPHTAVPQTPPPRRNRDEKPARKGLIGRTPSSSPTSTSPPASFPALVEMRRKKMLAKSLSVSIAPPDLDLPGPRSASYMPDHESPVSADLPTSVSRRSHTLPLAASHPHARKNSILDGPQLELVTSPISPSASTAASTPFTPSASSSTFSLALDPISESTAYAYPPTPAMPSSPAMPAVSPIDSPAMRAYPPRRVPQAPAQGARSPIAGQPRTAHSATFFPPHTELLLYTYVALSGRVVLAPLPGSATPALGALRAALLRPARGGGSLALQAAGVPSPRHRRSNSFSAGLRALGAGIGILRSTTSDGALDKGDDPDPETPLPTLEVPPEMLAVDLNLAPGESRSYTYTLPLPAHLPPTFKGRTLRFSYELVVGVCRAANGGSVSRVMKVPIRVYNNVTVGSPARPYDLLWPIARRIHTPATSPVGPPMPVSHDDPKPTVEEVVRRPPSAAALASAHRPQGTPGSIAELERYAARLLAASSASRGFPWGVGDEGPGGSPENGGLTGCREAVEVLTRNLKKVSYDITKDGVTVAVLTFPKSAFRLGETVNGVVEVNWREGRGRVLQLTALLEAHESLPSTLARPPSHLGTARYLRRVHAEHHARFVLGTVRLGFALDIPSDGSPDFGIVSEGGGGGLEWKVRLCLLVGVADAASDAGTEGVRVKGLVRDEDADDADGGGGRGAWGSSWRAPGRLGVLQRLPVPALAPAPAPASPVPPQPEKPAGWTAFLAASFLGAGEDGYHDGDDFDEEGPDGGRADADDDEAYGYDGVKSDPLGGVGVGVRYGGRDAGWTEVRAEMVECVVPVRVWAGNTAFRAGDVVFDV
ncbi:Rgp1-domain-containing protein [Mycena pura]|uniref:Rgp1-domain-containing protein n=1 Tax=Mycena pura TaxID=153505 RepID=A0AAD6Y507_9AGAR|nr:Rgp1-domain-containing protein [Mycena pura]